MTNDAPGSAMISQPGPTGSAHSMRNGGGRRRASSESVSGVPARQVRAAHRRHARPGRAAPRTAMQHQARPGERFPATRLHFRLRCDADAALPIVRKGTGRRRSAMPACLAVSAGSAGRWRGPSLRLRRRTAGAGTAHDLVLDSSGVPDVANWVVLDANGTASWRAQARPGWRRFTRGEVLLPGAEIETGSDGEIMLVAGGDQLTIAPQGRLIVPLALGQDRRLRHERGHILVQIESRPARTCASIRLCSAWASRHDHRSRGRSRAEQRGGPRGRAGGDDLGPARPGGARRGRGSAPIGRSGRQPYALQCPGARHAGGGNRRAGLAPARDRDERTRSARHRWSGHPGGLSRSAHPI